MSEVDHEPRSVPEEKRLGSEPVYPSQPLGQSGQPMGALWDGVTKRELLAAMAMQGICADGIPGSHHQWDETAREAVGYADALLKELAK